LLKLFRNVVFVGRATGKNLFHRAIVQSGSALSSWGVATRPRRYAHLLADAVNCTSPTGQASSADYIHCFKKLHARTLVEAQVPGVSNRYLSNISATASCPQPLNLVLDRTL